MRRLLQYHAVVLSVLASAALGAAEDGLQLATLLPSRSAAPSTNQSATTASSSPLLTRFASALNISTAYATLPSPVVRLIDLPAELDPDHSLSMAAKLSLFEGRLVGEGDVSFRSQASAPQINGDARQRQGYFSLTRNDGSLRYGLNYRVAGKAAAGFQDLEMREGWAEWHQNILTVRTSLQQNSNNVDLDPTLARLTSLQERTTLGVAAPGWPQLSLSYAHHSVASSYEPQGIAPLRTTGDSADATVLYTQPHYQLKVASSYMKITDKLTQADTITISHTLGGAYRPLARLAVMPTFTWNREQHPSSAVRIESPTIALSVSYETLPKDFGFTFLGNYGKARSNDGLIDNTTSGAKGIFSWTPPGSRLVKPSLSLEARYSTMADKVYTERSTEEGCVLMRLKLTGIAWQEFFGLRLG